jgi:hypothetical protein
MKKYSPLSLAFLLVTLAGWAAAAGGDATPFSRSRWIAEQRAWGARFSGGVSPVDPELARALRESLEPRPPLRRQPAPRFTRISQDILAPEGVAAQAETEAEPSVAIDPERESHLLAGYQEDRFFDGGARALTYAVSRDSAHGWGEGLVPGQTVASGGPYERGSDPWVAFGSGGRAYYSAVLFNQTSNPNGIYVSTSADGGASWGDPVAVHSVTTADFDDKPSVVVDNRPDSPFSGRVYVGWDTITADQRQPVRVAWSADGGASFSPFATVYDQGENIGIVLLVGPGGVVHAVWVRFTGDATALLTARSEDGGDTWTAPVVIADSHFSGLAGTRTADELPEAAIDPRTGELYVVWQDDRFSPGIDQVALSLSTDGGDTWSEPRRVSDGPLDAPNFTPAVVVNGSGLLGVAYYSLRNDPGRRFYTDEYLAVSRDRGQSFGRSTRVSPFAWNMAYAALTSEGLFLGDYQGLAAGRQTFFPVWIATFLPSRLPAHQPQPDAFTWPIRVR